MVESPFLTLDDYWMGRNSSHRSEWTERVRENGRVLVGAINILAMHWHDSGVHLLPHPRGFGAWSGGWRPQVLNEHTPGAAVFSAHITAEAGDVFDPHGEVREWCWENQHILAHPEIDLYMEHPSITKGWCHLQTRCPRSQEKFPPQDRRRWFYP